MKLDKRFLKTESPHWRAPYPAINSFWLKSFSVLPLIFASLFVDFFETIRIFIISEAAGFFFEYAFSKIYSRETSFSDGSTFLISLLFACFIPFGTSTALILVGVFFAIVVGKECFGGIEQGIFQASLVGLAVVYMHVAVEITPQLASFFDWLLNSSAVSIANASHIALVFGILILFFGRVISWQVPAIFILILAVLSGMLGGNSQILLSGSMIFSIFFFLTDYSNSPISKQGRILYAFLTAIFVFIFKQMETTECALIHGILLSGVFSPLVDWYLKPKQLIS